MNQRYFRGRIKTLVGLRDAGYQVLEMTEKRLNTSLECPRNERGSEGIRTVARPVDETMGSIDETRHRRKLQIARGDKVLIHEHNTS
jgi:hypothetical protein